MRRAGLLALLLVVLLTTGCSPPSDRPTGGAGATCGNAPPGFNHRTTTIRDGGRLHYVVGGSGPAVVLLHGFPETWLAWRGVMPGLARGHTVIAPDLPGIGCSSPRPDGYDKQTLADDVHGLVSRLGFARTAVVGHDMGGMVAYAYARTYRAGTSHLVLSGSVLPGFGLERLIDPAVRGGGLPHLRSFMRPGAAKRLIVGQERDFLRRFIGSQRVVGSPAFDHYVRAYSRPWRATAALGLYRTLPRDAADNRAGIRPTDLPVLTVGGAEGSPATTTASAEQAAGDVRSVVLARAGHYVAEERPEAFATAVRDFLRPG